MENTLDARIETLTARIEAAAAKRDALTSPAVGSLLDDREAREWEPGDPVYPDEATKLTHSCGPCLQQWTADIDNCPDCGQLSTEALRSRVSMLEHYVGTTANRLGIDNPAEVRTDPGLERIGEASLAAIELKQRALTIWFDGYQHVTGVARRLQADLAAQREELEDLRMEQAQVATHRALLGGEAVISAEWRIWRRAEDGGEPQGLGTFYVAEAVQPYLDRPDRWIVRKRTVRTWRDPWVEVTV